MKSIYSYIYKLDKKETFIIGFYISVTIIMFLSSIFDFLIQNYIDFYFDIFFTFILVVGFIYFKYSNNIDFASHFIIIIISIGSYIFLVTSDFAIPIFIPLVSLSYFLLFSLKRSILYSILHQFIASLIYIYAYINNIPFDERVVVATYMASILMILLGVVYHISVENSYKKLYQSNRKNEILLHELNHRVKNNLQVILSIIQLQSFNSREKDKFLDLENRIGAIAKTYDMLIVDETLQYINMQKYISKIISNIQRGFLIEPNISISIDSAIQLPLKIATYIGLIINELVTNSYKYAFKGRGRGEITIIFKRDTKYRLVIKDNGVGFDSSIDSGSLGLELVYSLVKEQLRGTIECYSKNGTEYIIEF